MFRRMLWVAMCVAVVVRQKIFLLQESMGYLYGIYSQALSHRLKIFEYLESENERMCSFLLVKLYAKPGYCII